MTYQQQTNDRKRRKLEEVKASPTQGSLLLPSSHSLVMACKANSIPHD
jgi:hypothetical protein